MSLQITHEHEGKVVVVKASGKLTKEDYERMVPEIEQLMKQHGKLRLLFDMYDFHGWKGGSLWADTKFAFRHFGDLERLAIVGDKAWQHGMAVFCKPFTAAQVRYFDRTQADEAHTWIGEELLVPAELSK